MLGRELGDHRAQLGFCRSSLRRRPRAAGGLDFNLDGTAPGGLFLDAHCFFNAEVLATGQFCGLASRKSFTIGTMTGMRSISVTWVVLGKMANRDAERGCMSP
jgi:hypothetical protein